MKNGNLNFPHFELVYSASVGTIRATIRQSRHLHHNGSSRISLLSFKKGLEMAFVVASIVVEGQSKL
jgi:hypothetical protein